MRDGISRRGLLGGLLAALAGLFLPKRKARAATPAYLSCAVRPPIETTIYCYDA